MNKKLYAFISRHTPTEAQEALALAQGIQLVPIGDMDGFQIDVEEIAYRLCMAVGRDYDHTPYHGWRYDQVDGVVVVHAAAALNLIPHWNVGVFENSMRAEEGKPPTFEAVALHLFPKAEDATLARMQGFNEGYDEGVADGRTMI